MSNMNVCAQLCSTSIEDIMLDWADSSELLVKLKQPFSKMMTQNNSMQSMSSYVFARIRAKFQLNSIPPDDRWIRKFCRDQLLHAGYKLYRTPRTMMGL